MPRSTTEPRDVEDAIGIRRAEMLMTGYDRLEIVLPAALKRKLARSADALGLTMTDLTVEAIEKRLAEIRLP